eukprot:TRINITY_DN4499_c0_g1_i1.p1 TRINITY_DN4499_c0_g1~~TRINITY_DN4499_c0_g1_i1.p1  ORF type:complete len:207 (-),score=40.13 TRINITY_DN4499_c0_g1_i1:172-792(-)
MSGKRKAKDLSHLLDASMAGKKLSEKDWESGASDKHPDEPERKKKKELADFGLSGALKEDKATGRVKNGVTLKFAEAADIHDPTDFWRFYVYKGDEQINIIHMHRQKAVLVGKDRKVCDLVLMHPSVSKQHVVIQFRKVSTLNKHGDKITKVRPYIMDLGSTNGTRLNGEKIDSERFYELIEEDLVQFGLSTREYLIMNKGPIKKR